MNYLLLPKALKTCPKSNISPNLVTLPVSECSLHQLNIDGRVLFKELTTNPKKVYIYFMLVFRTDAEFATIRTLSSIWCIYWWM